MRSGFAQIIVGTACWAMFAIAIVNHDGASGVSPDHTTPAMHRADVIDDIIDWIEDVMGGDSGGGDGDEGTTGGG